jgi:hypothetical protein
MRQGIFLVIGLLILPGVVCANGMESLWEVDDFEFYVPRKNVRRGNPDKEHLTLLGFVIDESTMQEVQDKFGTVRKLPRKEHASERICYSSVDKRNETVLVIGAGPLGGYSILTVFKLLSNHAGLEESGGCKEIPDISRETGTNSGLKIGLSEQEIVDLLGTPSKKIGNDWFYLFEAKEKNKGGLVFTSLSSIHVKFENMKSTEISITRVTSN